MQPNLGLVAENGFFMRMGSPAGSGQGSAGGSTSAAGSEGGAASSSGAQWEALVPHADFSWKKMALPILQQYAESTDGSSIETKESALVWHYRDADPDFGSWQVSEDLLSCFCSAVPALMGCLPCSMGRNTCLTGAF